MNTPRHRTLPFHYLSHTLVAATALWSTSQLFAADNVSQLDHSETSFIKEASQGGQTEVELGKMAETKSQNADIKKLAEHLDQDHTKSGKELMDIAQKNGVTLPTDLKHAENREVSKLQDKTGAEFDKAFAEYAIKDHEKDIDKYQKALQNTKNADLRAYIEKNLPVLHQHLQLARNAGSAVGVDQRTLTTADRYLSNQRSGVGAAPGSETGSSINRTGASPDNRVSPKTLNPSPSTPPQ